MAAGGACGCPSRAEDRGAGVVSDPYPEIRRRGRELATVNNATEAAWVLEPLAQHEPQEVAVVMALGVHCEMLAVTEIARGGVEHVEMLVPLAIRAVTVAGWPKNPSASLWGVLAHNHPSGSAQPSPADVALWHSARKSFEVAGLLLLDHLVIGRGEFYSCLWGSRWRLTK